MRKIALTSTLVCAVALSACGGVEPLDDMQRLQAFAGAPRQPSGCMAPDVFAGLVAAGALLERPPLGPGDEWHAPWLLVPADLGPSTPVEYVPGLVGTPVRVQGEDGQPKAVRGLFFVPGERPAYVCGAGA